MRLHRVRRIHVHGSHEPAWLIRADRNQREINGSAALADLVEEWHVRGIAGEVDAPLPCHEDESAPERAVAIEGSARAEMMRARERHRKPADRRRFPPIELLHCPQPGTP